MRKFFFFIDSIILDYHLVSSHLSFLSFLLAHGMHSEMHFDYQTLYGKSFGYLIECICGKCIVVYLFIL